MSDQNTPDPKDIVRSSSIRLNVHMDKEHIPVAIDWSADDAPVKGVSPSEAFMLAIWDKQRKEAMRIDLWTQEMPINEMNHFFFQTLMTMSDTYQRATGDEAVANQLRENALNFGKKVQVIK